MLIFNNEFFLKFRRFLHIVIFCLLVVMVFVKYKMYNLKNEVRAIENKIIEGILILTGSIDKDANNIPLKD